MYRDALAFAAALFVAALLILTGSAGVAAAPRSRDARLCADATTAAWFRLDVLRERSTQLFAHRTRGRLFFGPSPDGRWFTYQAADGLHLINVHQTSDRLLASQVPLGVSWSADGKRLGFVAGEPSSESLWVVNADGSGLHQISGVHPYSTPTWSPDSRWLAFAISRDQKSTIVIARPDRTGMRAIARSAGAEIHWSPNGRWIAYEGRALPTRVRVIHPNGSDGHAVAVGLSPSWAPDSRRLVFNTGSPRKTFAIATVSGTRLYAFGKVDAGPAYWSPRGARIVYVEGGLIGRRDQLYAAGAQGRRARQLTHDRPVAYEDPIEDVRWVTRGRYVGRLLYYSRALCDSTP